MRINTSTSNGLRRSIPILLDHIKDGCIIDVRLIDSTGEHLIMSVRHQAIAKQYVAYDRPGSRVVLRSSRTLYGAIVMGLYTKYDGNVEKLEEIDESTLRVVYVLHNPKKKLETS